MRCHACNEINPSGYRFCLQCGAEQPQVGQATLVMPESPTPAPIAVATRARWVIPTVIVAFVIGGLVVFLLTRQQTAAPSQEPSEGLSVNSQVSPTPTASSVTTAATPRSTLLSPATATPTPKPVPPGTPTTNEAAAKTLGTVEPPGGIYSGSDVTQKALIVSKPQPQYTEEARKNQITGTVVLGAVFGADGEVKNIRTVSGLPFGLTARAVEAARLIKFTPAIKDGRPVSMYIQLEYEFRLY